MHVLLANYDNHIPWLLESSRRVWPKYICLCNVMLFSYFWYLLFCVFTSLYFHGRGCQPMQSTLSVVVWTVVEVGDIRIIFAKTLMNHLLILKSSCFLIDKALIMNTLSTFIVVLEIINKSFIKNLFIWFTNPSFPFKWLNNLFMINKQLRNGWYMFFAKVILNCYLVVSSFIPIWI